MRARAGGMHAEHSSDFSSAGLSCKHRLQPGDPVGALAGLAVGNALEARPRAPLLAAVNTARASASGTLPTR